MYMLKFKRSIDLLLSSVLIILFLPLMLVILMILCFTTGGNPIFIQQRAGKDEKSFLLFKFRTMNGLKTPSGELAEDQFRLTSFGRFLRKSSLDELPQLINVLIGDMSLIGPRPLFVKYLGYYYLAEKKRHSIRPGISGWAQVNGRNNANWDERLKLDIYYVDNLCFRLDMLILYKTVINIILSKDVVVDESYLIKDLDEERSGNVIDSYGT